MTRTLPWLVAVLAVAGGLGSGIAFALGIALAVCFGAPARMAAERAARPLLQLTVVGLGATVSPGAVVSLGLRGVLLTLVVLVVALVAASRLARRFGLDGELGLLLGAGTAICGASAISAVATARRSPATAMGPALAVVLLLNAVALYVYPWLGDRLALTDRQFGAWCALAIHDTSSVVGAAAARSASAVSVATTLKVLRALWIVPVTFVLSTGAPGARRAARPWYLALFLLVVVFASLLGTDHTVVRAVAIGARRLLIGVMVLVGASLDVARLRAAGLRPLALGLVLAAGVSGLGLIVVRLVY